MEISGVKYRKFKRLFRLQRVLVLLEAYYNHSMMNLKRQLVGGGNNTYESAEEIANIVNAISQNKKCTPHDFMIDSNVMVDEIIDHYQAFKEDIKSGASMGMEKDDVQIFCDRVDASETYALTVKPPMGIYYTSYVYGLICYICGDMGKSQLLELFSVKSPFTHRVVLRDYKEFIKNLLKIEDLYLTITSDRVIKNLNTKENE